MRSYVILSVFPTGVFREVYTTYLLPSKFYGYTPYRVNRGNNHYMLDHFLLIFPQGLKEFYQHILHYSSHFSHRVFGGDLIEDDESL